MGLLAKYPLFSLKSIRFFVVFLSCLSCQSPHKAQPAFQKQNAKKIKADKKEALKQNPSAPQSIDKNDFETRADSFYLKAETAFFTGDNTKALKYFKKALLYAPDSFHLWTRIADIYEQEGLFAEALSHYRKLLQKTGTNNRLYEKLTDIYALSGLNEKALEQHQQLLNQEPDNFSLWFKQALLLIRQEDWTSALKALNTAETKKHQLEEKIQLILSQAYILNKLDDKAKSLKTMNKLADLQIHNEELALKIAGFYKSLNQNLLALSYLEDFQKKQGFTKEVSKTLLDYYISFEKWDEAIRQMKKIQVLGQLENYHYFYMAVLLIEKQNYDQALAFLKDLIAKEPQNGQYLYLLASVYEHKKDWLKALEIYRRVHSSSPHFLMAGLNSARVLSRMGQKQSSLNLLKKLSFSEDGDCSPQALLIYAESLWNSGNKKKALLVLTKGLNRKASHEDLLFLRGFYRKQIGQTSRALEDMRQILKTQENHEEALNFIASFYSEQKTNLNMAEKMARKALSLKPQSVYFLNTLGWILFQKGKAKSALYYLKKAFSKNKKDSLIAKRLGKVYLQLKNFKKSDYFFKEALKMEENAKSSKAKSNTLIPKQAFRH